MRWFGLPEGRCAFQALHSDGRCYGLSDVQLKELYRTADLIVNLHGGTRVQPEHIANGRLLFLETDPVEFAIYLAQGMALPELRMERFLVLNGLRGHERLAPGQLVKLVVE